MDKNFFSTQVFTADELEKLRKSAEKYLAISKKNREPEVKFHFTYMTLIKIGIYLIAKEGYRVKSRPGHHQQDRRRQGALRRDAGPRPGAGPLVRPARRRGGRS